MALPNHQIIEAIDAAPLNRGLKGIDWVTRPGNVAVTFDNGDIALFDHEEADVYQIHLLFQSRGRKAIEHVREAFRVMFTDHNCGLVIALAPSFRRDVKLLARWVGCKSAGMRSTPEGPCELFVLSKFQWKVADR